MSDNHLRLPPGVWAKIDRAGEHLDALTSEIAAFVDTQTDSLIGEANSSRTQYRFVLRFSNEPPMQRWALLVGDVIHNLRSALDHLAWQLGVLRGVEPHARTEFPIFKERGRFRKVDNNGRPSRASGWDKISSLKPIHRAIIEAQQPYHAGEQAKHQSLWVLQELNNVDKHRLLRPILLMPRGLEVDGSYETVGPSEWVVPTGPLNAETPTIGVLRGTHPIHNVKVKLDYTLGVGIEQGGLVGGVTGTLRNLQKEVERVAELFSDAFRSRSID